MATKNEGIEDHGRIESLWPAAVSNKLKGINVKCGAQMLCDGQDELMGFESLPKTEKEPSYFHQELQ